MTDNDDFIGQAGNAASEDPAEGSVESGEAADATDSGQSSRVAQVADPSAHPASSEAPAEG